jgi:hypothetical protein
MAISIFQSTDKNPSFSTRGNGQFGNVIRTGWKPTRLGEKKQAIIAAFISESNVDKVYMRKEKIYAFFLNGTEKEIA